MSEQGAGGAPTAPTGGSEGSDGGDRRANMRGTQMLRGERERAPSYGSKPADPGKVSTAPMPPKAKEPAAPAPSSDLSAEDLEAIVGDAPAGKPSAGGEETIRIGNLDVPISALSALPASELKKIKRKLKAGGRELEVTLADALEAVPRAEGWQQRMWEAQQQKKKLEEVAHYMSSDALGAYARLHGISREEAAQAFLQQIEREPITAEEKRARALEEKARKADEYERTEQERRQQVEVQRAMKEYERGIGDAMRAAGLRDSKRNVRDIAAVLDAAMREGTIGDSVSEEDYRWAAGIVAKEIAEERKSDFGDADGEVLISRIGEEQAKKIARAYAERVRKAQRAPERPAGSPPRASSKPKQGETWKDYLARKDREMGARR